MEGGKILSLSSERTPVRQKDYFDKKTAELETLYPGASMVTCGYGRHNAGSGKTISEDVQEISPMPMNGLPPSRV